MTASDGADGSVTGAQADSQKGSQADSQANARDWPEVRVAAGDEADVERLERWLTEAGALSITLLDRHDASAESGHAVLEPLPGETRLWSEVTLVALFEQGLERATLDRRLYDAARQVGLEAMPPHAHSRLPDSDWERAWLDDYAPMRFGQRLIVAPHGMEADASGDDVVLRLDPGLAFGTGTHPTTALCLEWLDAHAARLPGCRTIDYGAGSGVLAIAALLLGADAATAVDIDPQAHLASCDNAQRNGIADRLTVGDVDLLDGHEAVADVLLANILHGPLLSLGERFAALLEPGGHLVLSGLLDAQSASLRVRYTPWFDFEPDVTRDGWARLWAVRRG